MAQVVFNFSTQTHLIAAKSKKERRQANKDMKKLEARLARTSLGGSTTNGGSKDETK